MRRIYECKFGYLTLDRSFCLHFVQIFRFFCIPKSCVDQFTTIIFVYTLHDLFLNLKKSLFRLKAVAFNKKDDVRSWSNIKNVFLGTHTHISAVRNSSSYLGTWNCRLPLYWISRSIVWNNFATLKVALCVCVAQPFVSISTWTPFRLQISKLRLNSSFIWLAFNPENYLICALQHTNFETCYSQL